MSYDDWKLATPPEFDDEPRRSRYYSEPVRPAPPPNDDHDLEDIQF